MEEKWKLFAFDFDGVLVDSYSCLPLVYDHIARYIGLENSVEKFVKRALEYEDEQDAKENYDRKSWWCKLYSEFQVDVGPERLDELLQIYWGKRSEQSEVIEGTTEALQKLRGRRSRLIILAASDGQHNRKKTRIQNSGLSEFFSDVLVTGEDVADEGEGIKSAMKKYGFSGGEIAFINDKPAPINRINRIFKDITTIKVKFEGILKRAWNKEECMPTYRIRNINELLKIIE